jgi:hypothetical protein
LQRDGGGRDHDGFVCGDGPRDRGHEVRERLTGAGARLDGEMLTGVEGVGHRFGHLDLTAPLAAAKRGDRDGEQFGDRRHLGRGSSYVFLPAGEIIRVEIAGSPRDSFRPSHGRLCRPSATRARAAANPTSATG